MTAAVTPDLRSDLRQWRTRAAAVGGAGTLLMLVGLFVSPFQFYQSYLWAYILIIALTLGPLAWLMLQYLTGGAWGIVIRRPCEAAARTIPWVALLFLPIFFGIRNLYPWSHADVVAGDEVLQHKQPYLNLPFFLIRTAIYFTGWILLSRYFNRWSEVEDREGPEPAHRKMGA